MTLILTRSRSLSEMLISTNVKQKQQKQNETKQNKNKRKKQPSLTRDRFFFNFYNRYKVVLYGDFTLIIL